MVMTSPSLGHPTNPLTRSSDHQLARYQAYRRRQARALLRLVPKEAIRPLYRRALAEEVGPGDSPDPMETLVQYCGRLLPLPPLEVWLQDTRRSPDAHLQDVDASAEAPSADAPVTVETRVFSFHERPWIACLRSFRDGDTWRGFIAFEDSTSGRTHRTALIFREADPVEVRERFLSFGPSALVAFLRSALP